MKKLFKYITALLILTLSLTMFIGCKDDKSKSENNNQSVTLSLNVQCSIVSRYDCNAFILTTENLNDGAVIDYQISENNGIYKTVKQTSSKYVAYRCYEEGEFSVRAYVKVNGKEYYSNACSYTTVKDGGDTFGYSYLGEAPSHNIDLSNDNGDNPYIEHKVVGKYSEEYAFYKGVYAEKFVLTATIEILGTNSNDPYPKVGLFAKNGKDIYYSAFDPSPKLNANTLTFAVYKSAWSWYDGIYVSSSFRDSNNNSVKHSMTLLRDGTNFYIAVDGVYVSKRTISGLSGKTVVGTFTMSQNALFSEYSCFVDGSNEYANALTQAKSILD